MDDHAAAAAHGWQVAQHIVGEAQYDLSCWMRSWRRQSRPGSPWTSSWHGSRQAGNAALVLTARNAPPALIEIADLVSEIQPIKHPLQQGIKAQRGIEF